MRNLTNFRKNHVRSVYFEFHGLCSKLINLNSVSGIFVLEAHEYAFLPPMEADAHLILAIANVAEPVASVVLSHRADERTAHLVQL